MPMDHGSESAFFTLCTTNVHIKTKHVKCLMIYPNKLAKTGFTRESWKARKSQLFCRNVCQNWLKTLLIRDQMLSVPWNALTQIFLIRSSFKKFREPSLHRRSALQLFHQVQPHSNPTPPFPWEILYFDRKFTAISTKQRIFEEEKTSHVMSNREYHSFHSLSRSEKGLLYKDQRCRRVWVCCFFF